MAVPDFQSLMLPLLLFVKDGKEHTSAEAREHVQELLKLSDTELGEMMPSGRQSKFANRLAWAKMHLQGAGLITATQRGSFCITARGHAVIRRKLDTLKIKVLEEFPEYRAFRGLDAPRKKGMKPAQTVDDSTSFTPQEALEKAHAATHRALMAELLNLVRAGTSTFFEQLVIDLLVKMGYGGSQQDAARAVGRSGDEGIDGIIDEDRLGLDVIYVQAKKWTDSVGRPDLQKFVGALQGKRARKGIFITTSEFTKEAREYVRTVDNKVVLIDGARLAELMIEFDVGVATVSSYAVKRVDTDFFEG